MTDDALDFVRDRLAEKIPVLTTMLIEAIGPNAARLSGKIEGIKLAISYIEDEMKMTDKQVEWVRSQRGK